jgi:predicted  nucleic acid-binding Zn-ribbon protein
VSEVEVLDRIDRADRERARLLQDADRLRGALKEAEGAVAARTAEEQAARAAFDALRTEERAVERRIEELRDKRRSAVRVLETGAGDPAAAQRQVERCDALIDEAETQVLGLMDTVEAAKRASADATTRRAQAEQVLATASAEMPPRIESLSSQAATVGAAADADVAALPAELRNRYRGLREKGRWPVARAKGGKCDACSMTAQPQMVADLKRGRLIECQGCRRWLLLPPE